MYSSYPEGSCRLPVAVVNEGSLLMAGTHCICDIAVEILKHLPSRVNRLLARVVALGLDFRLDVVRREA